MRRLLMIQVLAALALWGCKDECEDLDAQAEIEVRLLGISADRVKKIEVTMVINSGLPIRRTFDKASVVFTFEFKEWNHPPRTIEIAALAMDDNDSTLGKGKLETTFLGNGCNFFAVTVLGASTDGGLDGPGSDLAGGDVKKVDQPVPDLPGVDSFKPDK